MDVFAKCAVGVRLANSIHQMLWLWITYLAFNSASGFAQSDIIGTAGQYATQTGARGAVANRQLADSLYKQSLADEHAAWSGGIPNVGLLSKALNESKDAKSADDQAKEFARAALYGGDTAGTAGDYQASRYGGLDQSQLQSLATTNSPYEPAVESKMGGYGLKLASDQMSLNTPFGKFPVGMSGDDLSKTLVGVVTSLGFSGDGVAKGISDAEKTRDALAAQTVAQVDARLAARGLASTGASATGDGKTPETAALLAGAKPKAAAALATAGPPVPGSTTDLDEDQQRRLNQANQDAIRRQMGLSVGRDPIGRSDEDIFQKIHLRYQSLTAAGEFMAETK